MLKIRYVKSSDKSDWYRLDGDLPESEFREKVMQKRGYVILDEVSLIGILRYNLFWDTIPFCTHLYIEEGFRRKGCGTALMKYWERDMKARGSDMLMTSTQVNEEAQHFYRKLGYKDCGGFVIDIPSHSQPMEMIMIKAI